MTKQELLETRWRVYLNYGGPVPLPDHLADLLPQIESDVASVTDSTDPLQPPDSAQLVARIYHVSSSLPASPRQNLVIGWKEADPFFTLTTEVAQ